MAQYQRSEYRQQFLPEVDHRLAVWQAYLNVINSFLGSDMIGGSEQGGSINFTRTTQERFIYHLGVLDSLIDEDKKDPKMEPKSFRQNEKGEDYQFQNLPDLLDKYPPDEFGRVKSFSEYFRYWTRIDRLMRAGGFYTTSKVPSGHL